jgi:hypothetical protein
MDVQVTSPLHQSNISLRVSGEWFNRVIC